MANQIVVSAGAKVRNLNGVLTGTSGVVSSVPLGAENGVATLDSGGKVPVSQLPSSVVTYLGTWNAATNTPTLVNGTGDAGDMYICNVAGTVNFGAGPVTFAVGDWVLYGSGTWQKSSGQNGTVTSVAVTESGDSLNITGSPISTSGTINIGFNGTNLQYVNGAGNLTTFPILTGYVPYTGATQDVDLGAFSLNGKSLHIKGTAGNGHLGLKHQSAAATGSANESLIYADSLGDLSWQNANLYLSKFITSANTANRSYTFPNANGTVALTSDLSNYVDLTTAQTIGGTKTFSDATKNNGGIFLQNASSSSLAGYMNIGGLTNGVKFTSGGGVSNTFTLPSATGYTFTFPNATGTIALTSDISYPVTSVFGRTGAVVATSGDYTTAQVTESGNLYFTDSRARLALSFVAGSGAYNSTTGVITIPTNNNQITNGAGYITSSALSGYLLLTGGTLTGNLTFAQPVGLVFANGQYIKDNGNGGLFIYSGAAINITSTSLTNNSNTILDSSNYNSYALPLTGGTLTGSVTATSFIKTSGTSSQFLKADGSVDSTTYGTGTVTSVGLSAPTGFSVTGSPVTSSGTLALAFASGYSLPTTIKQSNWDDAYTFVAAFPTQTGNSGKYLTTDGSVLSWATNPLGTVTSVAALTIGTTGTDLSSSVATGTTTPVITLNVPTASATNRGALSSADWTTFNNKQSALTNPVTGTGTTNYLPKFTGASTIGNSQIFDNGTNVGVGTASPNASYRATISGAASGVIGGLAIVDTDGASYSIYSATNNLIVRDVTNSATRLTLSASGNLGLGVTPSAWGSVFKVLESGDTNNQTAVAFQNNANVIYLTTNSYFDTSWKYKFSDNAGQYLIDGNEHRWYNAPSGTAGAAITFTQAMTLTAAGRLLINTPTESTYQLDVNGTGRFSGQTSIGGTILGSALLTVRGSTSIAGGGVLYLWNTANSTAPYIGNSSNDITFYTNVGGTALTLASTGAATFSGQVLVNNSFTNQIGLVINGNTTGGIRQNFIAQGSSGTYNFQIGTTITTNNAFEIIPSTAADGTTFSTAVFKILNTGAATFNGGSSNIPLQMTSSSSNGTILGLTNNNVTTYSWGINAYTNGNLYFQSGTLGAGSNAFYFTSAGAATFSSSVTATNYFSTAATTSYAYSYYVNTGAAMYLGIERSTGQGLFTGSSAYATVFGSNNATNLQFGTNGIIRATITSGGNVGIGTSSPQLKFVVSNGGAQGFEINSNSGAYAGGVDVICYNRSTSAYAPMNFDASQITFATNAAGERMRITSGGVVQIGGSPYGGTNIKLLIQGIDSTSSNYTGYWQDSATNPLFYVRNDGLTYLKGNVLIGTTDDGGKLVSYSTTAATQIKAAGTAPAITFSNTVLSPTIGGVLGVATAANQFFTGTASSDMVLANQFTAGALIFGTSNVERFRISAAGASTFLSSIKATNYITITNQATIPALTTATILTLSSSAVGVYIIQGNFGGQGNAAYGSTLIVVANLGDFRIVTNGSGSNSALTLSGANVQITNVLGISLDAYGTAILIGN